MTVVLRRTRRAGVAAPALRCDCVAGDAVGWRCRCDAVPQRALQSAGMLFEHRDICHAAGDRLIKITSAFSEPFNKALASKGRRRLQAASSGGDGTCATASAGEADDDALLGGGDHDLQLALGPMLQAAEAAERDSIAGGANAGRTLLQNNIPPEYGFEREKQIFARAVKVAAAQRANLKATRWLGAFEPMMPSCPLTARKIAPEAVSEFASLAWRCDGLGFSWDCLQGSAPIEEEPAQPPPAATNASAVADSVAVGHAGLAQQVA